MEDIFLSIRVDEDSAASIAVAVADEILLEPSMRASLVEEDETSVAAAAPLSTVALLYSCSSWRIIMMLVGQLCSFHLRCIQQSMCDIFWNLRSPLPNECIQIMQLSCNFCCCCCCSVNEARLESSTCLASTTDDDDATASDDFFNRDVEDDDAKSCESYDCFTRSRS